MAKLLHWISVSPVTHRHGSPYDRGMADSYYGRPRKPHFYEEGTYRSRKVEECNMTEESIREYYEGYEENEKDDFKKEW